MNTLIALGLVAAALVGVGLSVMVLVAWTFGKPNDEYKYEL